MRNLSKYYIPLALFFTLLVGSFFRLYKIDQVPQGVYVDEAAIGYNAYSILETGKDEYGKSFPVMFRSFATFQSPVYTYITVPFVHLFGLNSLSTRLPSAIFGILSILVLYYLVRVTSPEKYKDKLPIISSALLAISPWHIQYSRTAYETNVALFFLLLGLLLFFHAIKKPWLFVPSSISLALSFNAYRAETLIIPLVVLVLGISLWTKFVSKSKMYFPAIIISTLLGILLVAPMISIIRTPGFQARSSELNIFSFNRQLPWGFVQSKDDFIRILNNKPFLAIREFASLYTSYLSPRYMFALGDSGPRKPIPNLGTFYIWQFPLYLAGLYFLLKEKNAREYKILVFSLLLTSPIPAALTRDPYSTLRSLSLVVPQMLLISFGLYKIWENVWGSLDRLKPLLLYALIFLSSAKLFISIFYHHEYFRSQYWNYGWAEAFETISKLDPDLPVIVDNSLGDTYILALFHLSYDPETYQINNFEVSANEYYSNMSRDPVKRIGNITVKKFQWGVDTENTEQYIVADPIAISDAQIEYHKLTIIKQINYPNREPALRILKTNPINNENL